ncbi:VPS10 domain-containing protein [Thermaurantimonas sp.]|uniref:VPS10 domain-containing protein n=1 Tax=Thermaurantimonas sp. TaxID=2681568 RepID=UPI00391A465C
MNMNLRFALFACMMVVGFSGHSQKNSKQNKPTNADNKEKTIALSGLKWRSIGPATFGGRIADIAVNPGDFKEYYLAIASGGIFKTTNGGVTFTPIFENQASYSIGCLAIDPKNPKTVWAGSGENNNQRSVGYGDGVYRSDDGGRTWRNLGLKTSEHIGMIAIDPRNSDHVYVAAYGPLWSKGGERGIYKTTDGGQTWQRLLHVSDHTGFSEIHIDRTNPDRLYATAHQRRRHTFTYISGGPESALYVSNDAGRTWDKVTNGLPKDADLGRISLAQSPANPQRIYLMVEGHGIYVSTDRGNSFQKTNDYYTSGNYYVKLIAHPTDELVCFSMDTYTHITRDGGKTWVRWTEDKKHVDNHALWINPKNPHHMLNGNDGGLYETYDGGQSWRFIDNLPILQLYRVSVDNEGPFYNVYGGTQDNSSVGGPSRTRFVQGITNADWFVTQGGDGFKTQIDPQNPNIVYAQYQYGGLARYDRATGERVMIRPIEEPDSPAYRFNWDAPLILSHHQPGTLYFAAQKVLKSTDYGSTWKEISPDLSRQIDRNTLKVMDRYWGVDAIARHRSTTPYGNVLQLTESPLKAGRLAAGTDDGLIHITDDDGRTWRQAAALPGVPERAFISALQWSSHSENTLYAAANNHQDGDFRPYLFRSTDAGRTWQAITTGLPDRGSVWCIAEDPVEPNLLFTGTEFSIYTSLNGGQKWQPLNGGLPTIPVRDIAIQATHHDLVIATFGRGFYILDDYSVLRDMVRRDWSQLPFAIASDRPGLLYQEANKYGYSRAGFLGDGFFMADNPPVGKTFTFYLKEAPKTLRDLRKEKEKKANPITDPLPNPTLAELRAEKEEEKPYLIFAISDQSGQEIARFTTDASAGLRRVTWDGRYTARHTFPTGQHTELKASAHKAPAGSYSLSVFLHTRDTLQTLVSNHSFELMTLDAEVFPAKDNSILLAQRRRTEDLRRQLTAAGNQLDELTAEVRSVKNALRIFPGSDPQRLKDATDIERLLGDISIALRGNKILGNDEIPMPTPLADRLNTAIYALYYYSGEPTGTALRQLDIVADQLPTIIRQLREARQRIEFLTTYLIDIGGPYWKTRLPENQR